MSSTIWTQCAGVSELRPLRLEPWRAVEAQHQVSTRKLVDSDAEQQLLEEMIDAAKPADRTRGRLHYLLSTPFRYPPLRYGSRFGSRQEPGIWYGAETQRTAFAEVAYYRLLFLEGTKADLGLVQTELTLFRATLVTQNGVDLTLPPFDAHRATLTSRSSYSETQAVGSDMRAAGVEAFRYTSARDPEAGIAVGAFAPAVFGRRQPKSLETWHCAASKARVEFTRRDYFRRASHMFEREVFLVDGALPSPAV
jgi:hypothetical protein